MLSRATVVRIRRLAARGYGTVVIGRQVGVAPKTVRRYLSSTDAEVQKRPRARSLSPQQVELVMTLFRGEARLNARRTAELAADGGVKASARTIQRVIAANRRTKRAEASAAPPTHAGPESYDFSWAGKSAAQREVQEPAAHVLKQVDPRPRRARRRPAAELIEGDNLEAMKILRDQRGAFAKLIYVDPPYGTGRRFTFDDRLAPAATRTRRDARHASWLSMLYSRLAVARDLLVPNGVVAVSIDDRRVHQVRMLLDELYGDEEFVGCIAVRTNPRGKGLRRHVATNHEYLVIYAKDRRAPEVMRGPRLGPEEAASHYRHSDERGRYAIHPLRGTDHRRRRDDQPSMFYPLFVDPATGRVASRRRRPFIVCVYPEAVGGEQRDGVWCWGHERASRNAHLLFAKRSQRGVWRVYRKTYAEEEPTLSRATSIWTDPVFSYAAGKRAADTAVGRHVFEFAKPVELLRRLVEMTTRRGTHDVALDLFAGSGALAEALAAANAADSGNRRVVAIQTRDAIDVASAAYSAGYRTIADICRARMRRACAPVKMSMRTYRVVPADPAG